MIIFFAGENFGVGKISSYFNFIKIFRIKTLYFKLFISIQTVSKTTEFNKIVFRYNPPPPPMVSTPRSYISQYQALDTKYISLESSPLRINRPWAPRGLRTPL